MSERPRERDIDVRGVERDHDRQAIMSALEAAGVKLSD
jgi:hypothetical protein